LCQPERSGSYSCKATAQKVWEIAHGIPGYYAIVAFV
jgi:hypothetical protein